MGGTTPRLSGRARWGRLVIAACIGVIAALGIAAPASGHPFLLFTSPGLDGAVADSPESVTLVFNEPVTIPARAITITDSAGKEVKTRPATATQGGAAITAAVVQKLPPGVYQVRWEATGIDGHGAEGKFRFAVGTVITDGGDASDEQPADWLAAGIRWLLLAGFAVAFGGLVGERITSRVRRRHEERLPRVGSWVHFGALVGLLAATATALKLSLEAGSPTALWASTAGRVSLLDAAGFAAALALLAAKRPHGALLPLAVVAFAEGIASHSEIELPGVGALLTAVHLAAAGVWTGALLHIGRVAKRWRATPSAAREALLGYARMVAWLFVLVALTGVTMALLLVQPSALTGTSYGRALLVKVALVLIVAGLALGGRWALRARRDRALAGVVRVEAVALVVVLGATSVLVSTPTPGNFTAPPPPPPRGVAVPAGGLAGQIGVNLVASEGQVVVRLATPTARNEFEPAEAPEYTLSGQAQGADGAREPLDFRSCGEACFVAPASLSDGDNVLTLRAGAPGWRGGRFAALIPWPAKPAGDLVERTTRVMSSLDTITVYEAVTSDGEAGLPRAEAISIDAQEFLDGEPYNSGVAPVAAQVTTESGATKLLMGFPAAGTYVEVTLDGLGRITQETLAAPSHLMHRRFDYPADE